MSLERREFLKSAAVGVAATPYFFSTPKTFAQEAKAAGAYGENVRDPAEIAPALHRGLSKIRNGVPAVISVWLPRVLQQD